MRILARGRQKSGLARHPVECFPKRAPIAFGFRVCGGVADVYRAGLDIWFPGLFLAKLGVASRCRGISSGEGDIGSDPLD